VRRFGLPGVALATLALAQHPADGSGNGVLTPSPGTRCPRLQHQGELSGPAQVLDPIGRQVPTARPFGAVLRRSPRANDAHGTDHAVRLDDPKLIVTHSLRAREWQNFKHA
jgi:hypothetical protein